MSRSQKSILKSRYQGSRGVLDLRIFQRRDLQKMGQAVVICRKSRGMTQKENAAFLGISYKIYQRIEKGTYLGKHLLTIVRKEPCAVPRWMITLFIQKGWCDSIGDIFG